METYRCQTSAQKPLATGSQRSQHSSIAHIHYVNTYRCELHTRFVTHTKSREICNFHVLNHLLLIYICKLHWNHWGYLEPLGLVDGSQPRPSSLAAAAAAGHASESRVRLVVAASSFLRNLGYIFGLSWGEINNK